VLWLLIAVLLAATAHAAGHEPTDHPAVDACDRAAQPMQTFVVARGDSLWRLMHEAGFSKQQWQAVVALDGPVKALCQLKPGKRFACRAIARAGSGSWRSNSVVWIAWSSTAATMV
tara:strand:+ start:975 stop:1322 length:348 start_codon:yes stop_codon:yes gene_type:complete